MKLIKGALIQTILVSNLLINNEGSYAVYEKGMLFIHRTDENEQFTLLHNDVSQILLEDTYEIKEEGDYTVTVQKIGEEKASVLLEFHVDLDMQIELSEDSKWQQQILVTIHPEKRGFYSMDGIHFQEDNSFIIQENGEYTFYLKKDEDIVQKTIQINHIDHTPPIFEEEAYTRKGFLNPVISIHAKDEQSQINQYTIYTNSDIYHSSSNQFQLKNQNEYLLKIEVEDNAGNVQSMEIDNDVNPIGLQVKTSQKFNTYSNSVLVNFIVKQGDHPMFAYSKNKCLPDDPSLQYSSQNPIEIKENGTFYFYVKNTNNGDHYLDKVVQKVIFLVDTLPPSIESISVTSNYDKEMEYSNSNKGMHIQIQAIDPSIEDEEILEMSSGIYKYTLIDEKGNTIQKETGNFDVFENGQYTCIVEDGATNQIEKEISISSIDTNPPLISFEKLEGREIKDHFIAFRNPIDMSVVIQDDLSGINKDKTFISSIDSFTWQDDSLHFQINKENEPTYYFIQTEDNVENKSEMYIHNLPILIDMNKPLIKEEIAGIQIVDGKDWICQNQILQYSLSDMSSGIYQYSLSINNQKIEAKQFDSLVNSYGISIPTQSISPYENGLLSIELVVEDNAGNISSFHRNLYIDVDSPILSYSFDMNNESSFYSSNRQLSISIQEMNFDPSLLNIKIQRDGIEIPWSVHWKLISGIEGNRAALWQTNIIFSEDGKYSIYLDGKDKVGHSIQKPIQESFTIDHTKPIISVSFDNNSSMNSFYASYRHATVSITERNFDPKMVSITGKNISFHGNWLQDHDTYSTTIPFEKDGEYDLHIEAVDQAGNSDSFDSDSFVIDTKPPVIKVEGLKENMAYANEVMPSISITDQNFKIAHVNVTGIKNKKANWNYSITNIENGQMIQFTNLERIKENDDVYLMEIQGVDQAGNKEMVHIPFSVNRFGSSYIPYFKEVLDKKYNSSLKEDIRFSEINVNEIQDVVVRVNENGIIKELKKDMDYTLSKHEIEGGFRYDYEIKKELFINDGIYEIYVSSKDLAGNINENTMDSKDSMFIFCIDHTIPDISITGVESHHIYNMHQIDFTVMAWDEIGIQSVEVFVNDECVYSNDSDTKCTLSLFEKNGYQSIRIRVKDLAGNSNEIELNSILVTTNPLARWFYNRPLFIFTIGLILSLLSFQRMKHKKMII